MEPSVGFRVVRGPDWCWEDQDGGEGCVGTVVEVGDEGRSVLVQWDCGIRSWYRSGEEGKFDLRVLDTAPTGMNFPDIICSGCYVEGVAGMHWQCAHCYEYHLCHSCYLLGRHCQEHPFFRVQSKDPLQKVKVSPRADAKKVEAKGIFPGAEVVRGPHWRFKDQDGGAGNPGRVMAIEGWQVQTARCVARVEWIAAGTKANVYRVGYKGKVDLRCTKVGIEGHYFFGHLPILGGVLGSDPSCEDELASGDVICMEMDPAMIRAMYEAENLWGENLSKLQSNWAVVLNITGDVRVRVQSNVGIFTVIPGTVCKKKHIHVGKMVCIINDPDKARLLHKGKRTWVEAMKKTLGHVGRVRAVNYRGVEVEVGGDVWIYNPQALTPVPDGVKAEECTPVTVSVRRAAALGIGLNIYHGFTGPHRHLLKDDALLNGSVTALQHFLERSSLEDHLLEDLLRYYAKIGAMTAVKMLLDSGADPSYQTQGHDVALVKSVSHNHPELTKMLLDATDGTVCKAESSSLLRDCVSQGHIGMLKVLVAHLNIDVNAQDSSSGETALMRALLLCRNLCVPILLAAGANPLIIDHTGGTALTYAVRDRQICGLEYLIAHSPELITEPDLQNNMPLHTAILLQCETTVTFLLSQKPDAIDVKGTLDCSALTMAVCKGFSRMVELLVGWGADVNAVDQMERTPALLATKVKWQPFNDFSHLKKLHEDLVQAADGGYIDTTVTLVCFLVQEGASLHTKDREMQSPASCLTADAVTFIKKYVKYHPGSFRGSLREKHQLQGTKLPLQYPKIHQLSTLAVTEGTELSVGAPRLSSDTTNGGASPSSPPSNGTTSEPASIPQQPLFSNAEQPMSGGGITAPPPKPEQPLSGDSIAVPPPSSQQPLSGSAITLPPPNQEMLPVQDSH